VCRIQDLQERVAELEAALQREQDRSKLLQSDLARLRSQDSAAAAAAAATAAGPDAAAATAAAPQGGASAKAAWPFGQPLAAGGGALQAPASDGSSSSSSCCAASPTDMVLVSRQSLELLHLKERAMDAAKEGIVIADCSQPDMPLIYINEGFCLMTGYERSVVLGRNCRWVGWLGGRLGVWALGAVCVCRNCSGGAFKCLLPRIAVQQLASGAACGAGMPRRCSV
jgi:PAS domain-containing protein